MAALKKKKQTESNTEPKAQKTTSPELIKIVKDLNEKFGENAVMVGGLRDENGTIPDIPRIPTGSIDLDFSLGGGILVGRYTEISGELSVSKTTQVIHILVNAQNLGYTCAYIDVEGTTDIPYLESLGVDVANLIYSRPDGMEEALQILIDLQRGGIVNFGVLDSIAALGSTSEQKKDMDESQRMGIPQQLLGEFFRKYYAGNNRLAREHRTEFTLVGINQIREKITTFGDPEYCLHYDTLIPFVDGRCFPIGEVVEKKIEGEVWSFNEKTSKFEPAKIVDWADNGQIADRNEYINIFAVNSIDGVSFNVKATYDHQILTDTGWKEAQDLTLLDKVVYQNYSYLNGTLEQFLWGCLLGKGSLNYTGSSYVPHLTLMDSKNPKFIEWKEQKLNKTGVFDVGLYKRGTRMSQGLMELAILDRQFNEGNPLVTFLKEHFSPLSLAIWFLDRGYIPLNSKRIYFFAEKYLTSEEVKDEIKNLFFERGFMIDYDKLNRLCIQSCDVERFYEMICPYVPECMQYRLPIAFQGKYKDFDLTCEKESFVSYSPITQLNIAVPRCFTKPRQRRRYDIKVSKNHNFLAGGKTTGFVVHNTPGGRAKGFAQSLDVRLRRGDWIVEGTKENATIVGQTVKYKINKNKKGIRMQSGSFDFYFAENKAGILPGFNDNFKSMVTLGVKYGLIEQRGSWFIYKDEKYQGIKSLVETLRTQHEVVNSLHSSLMDIAAKRRA